MKNWLYKWLSLVGIAAVLCCSSCTPSQEQQVITDIQDIVNFAAAILSVVQSFGVLATAQQKSDAQIAVQYAQQVSSAAGQAVTEMNSSDPWNIKVTKVESLFAAIAPLPALQTQQINAAVQLTVSSVKLLLDQLRQNQAQAKIALNQKLQTQVPFTARHKLAGIKKKADKNVARAQAILAGTK